jgi:hypothetical protein
VQVSHARRRDWTACSCVARYQCYTGEVANLTLTLDDDLLLRARKRALDQGTSVNALVREYLETLAGGDPSAEVGRTLVGLAEQASGSSGRRGRSWTRDDVHAR